MIRLRSNASRLSKRPPHGPEQEWQIKESYTTISDGSMTAAALWAKQVQQLITINLLKLLAFLYMLISVYRSITFIVCACGVTLAVYASQLFLYAFNAIYINLEALDIHEHIEHTQSYHNLMINFVQPTGVWAMAIAFYYRSYRVYPLCCIMSK